MPLLTMKTFMYVLTASLAFGLGYLLVVGVAELFDHGIRGVVIPLWCGSRGCP